MNLAEAIAAARSAKNQDRPLTKAEFDGIREAKQRANPVIDDEELGALEGLERTIVLQRTQRDERARAADELARNQEQARKLAERDRLWAAETDTWTRAFELAFDATPSDPTLKLLHRCYQQAQNPETPTPQRWRADSLHPAERRRLGLE